MSAPSSYLREGIDRHGLAARAAGGSIDHALEIAGLRVDLRFAGPALVNPLTAAFGHLARAGASPASLTIHAFDTSSTGVGMPPPPFKPEDLMEGGAVRGWTEGRYRAVFHHDGPGLSLVDREAGEALFWVRDPARLPAWMTAAPLRGILHVWASRQGLQLTHAAAVGASRGGALVAGKGGSGKSTIALACLAAGLRYTADDYCLVDPGPPSRVFSLYATGKQRAADVGRVGALDSRMVESAGRDGDKAVYFLGEPYRERLRDRLDLRAVLVPRLTGEVGSRLIPISPATALAALAPSTMFQLAGDRREALSRLGTVVRGAPCFGLETGTDVGRVPGLIHGLVS